MLAWDWGMGMGGCHFRVVRVVRWGSWADPISKAMIPRGARKAAAWGRILSKCSTARRVTRSARKSFWRVARDSARSLITLILVNVSARVTSRRKVAFL
jgi:hypothetical protein